MKEYAACIRNFCLKCKQNDAWAVGNCAAIECALHPVRPNQSLCGQPMVAWETEDCTDQVLAHLEARGLKTLRSEHALAQLENPPHV